MSAFACGLTDARRVDLGGRGVAPIRGLASAIGLGLLLIGTASAFALDASQSTDAPKIPLKPFASAQQALRAGLDDLQAGDAKSSVEALSYAAEGGQVLAQWKLGSMYARGEGVTRDDIKAYHYFQQMIDNFNEDEPNRRDIPAISNAFVAVGIYCLAGIANSELKPDAARALTMFQYAATNFGDPEAQYRLALMNMDGAGGLAKDNMTAARWLALAADKHHRPAQAKLGHLLFAGDGVPRQGGRGLMWLTIAKSAAKSPKDDWIRDLYLADYAAASDDDRQVAALYLSAHARDVDSPSVNFAPRPLAPGGWNSPSLPRFLGSPPIMFDGLDTAGPNVAVVPQQPQQPQQ